MKRREFITLVGGAAAWPLAAHAQQPARMRRIGVLMPLAADDLEAKARLAAFLVFTQTTDPVGAGFVATLARPGGNATGFILFEFGISVKWLELIRDIAPRVTRAAVLRDPTVPSALGQLGAVQGVAPSFGVELILVDVRDAPEIERAVTAFAREANGSLIVLPSASAIVHRDLIITLAARYKLPAVYSARYFVTGGGLISYGPDTIDPHRRAAGYVDRILRGEKPADLPVQAPTKYETVINLKTAMALGLQIPDKLLALADEVIECTAQVHHVARRRGGVAEGGASAASR